MKDQEIITLLLLSCIFIITIWMEKTNKRISRLQYECDTMQLKLIENKLEWLDLIEKITEAVPEAPAKKKFFSFNAN